MDLVRWRLGSHKIRLYYPTAYKLAGQMRVVAKTAVELAGGNRKLWRAVALYDLEPSTVALNREYRRSGLLSNLKNTPTVDIDGELVIVQLDDLRATFHCTDALMAQAMLLRAARDAKRWAGDAQRVRMLSAFLTNATPDKIPTAT
jgi:hypothetical protein